MTLPALTTYPHVKADWDTLTSAAATLKAEGAAAEEAMGDAARSWIGFRTWYREDDTEEAVWNALEFLEPHAEDWATALSSAKDAIDDFVTTGEPLQREREDLDEEKPGLASRRSTALSSDDETEVEEVRADIEAFNERAKALTEDWDETQDTFETALGAISVGTTEGLPSVAADRSPEDASVEDGVLDWAEFTSGLDDAFGEIDPKTIWRDLKDLSEDELWDWLIANPEAARALAENELPGNPVPGSAEDRMKEAIAASFTEDGVQTEEGIADIRETWLALEDHERERLALLFPGIIGTLNGVPLATRGRTNQITVAGLREQTAEILAGHLDDKPQHAPGNARERQQWEDEKTRLETVLEGLDEAWNGYGRPHFPEDPYQEAGFSTLFVSTDGNGQIATMRGTPSASTENVAVFVPGTGTTIANVDDYNQDLDAIDGNSPETTVSIYWQGTDLPQRLIRDNASATYNEQGAPRLAAFDVAADLELSSSRTRDVRTTYVGHSAGGSLLGTAEREGLDSSAIVYVAPAGVGHEVGSPEDTANQYAERYWIQTRDDPIWAAQAFGGGAHGPSGWEGSNPTAQMGAHRLESGFLRDGTDTLIGEDDGAMGGHTSYFIPGSDSATNIQGVIEGTEVSPFVKPEHHYGFGYSYTEEVIETHREEYYENGLDTVPVDELED